MLLCGCTYTMGTAPLALGGLVQLGLKADEVVRSRTRVTQDDLPPLLAHLTVVLMIGLVAIPFLFTLDWRSTGRVDTLWPKVANDLLPERAFHSN